MRLLFNQQKKNQTSPPTRWKLINYFLQTTEIVLPKALLVATSYQQQAKVTVKPHGQPVKKQSNTASGTEWVSQNKLTPFAFFKQKLQHKQASTQQYQYKF